MNSSCTCTICLDVLLHDLQTTSCGHVYHRECINAWLKEKERCPLCNSRVLRRDLVKLYIEPLDLIQRVLENPNRLENIAPKVLTKFMEHYRIKTDDDVKEEEIKNERKHRRARRESVIVDPELDDLKHLGILGVGGFAAVSLVQDRKSKRTFALKQISKDIVTERNIESHVINEKKIMSSLESPFCCRLFRTYQDRLYVYLLMEPILGGELYTRMQTIGVMHERAAAFYGGCAVLALEYLHSKGVIYRDLKPENIVLTGNGYVKLVDFGFAKHKNKSVTMCGIPSYLAPEVILAEEQTSAIDWWCLGNLLYEMVVGQCPFGDGSNQKDIYDNILKNPIRFKDATLRKKPISMRCVTLISCLLTKKPENRLGSGRCGVRKVKSHPWWDQNKIDWKALNEQRIEAPFIPKIKNNCDLSNFGGCTDGENSISDASPNDDPKSFPFGWCQHF